MQELKLKLPVNHGNLLNKVRITAQILGRRVVQEIVCLPTLGCLVPSMTSARRFIGVIARANRALSYYANFEVNDFCTYDNIYQNKEYWKCNHLSQISGQ